ncbi:aromatic ring-hydroxylating dioxygenase subunit alpha [Pusillimonas sp. T2]|uniref:aromatic ring-hydroxylating oxygenase subunit alpha n=1 Tax=Pusillimonas sp. T2 TaxID=1548123 RepID=UPI000B8B5BFB|nr:Rieske 2Fe-2S domain-containing protein [Pusillimonas sp. T2]OXR47921.1 aromatic ring-hydroxylating dioxygenase subunit alpha [Pusillimonas sp. T2]
MTDINKSASGDLFDPQSKERNLNYSARSLVDIENGEISRYIFSDEQVYKDEIERIFKKSWLYVGHESQIKNPGDYVLSRMGDESVILNRDNDGKIHVFLNTCTHRGMKVCRYDEGNTRNFVCPYHGWSFRNNGDLAIVPQFEDTYKNHPFDKKEWGLVEVAQISTLRGTVWATWAEDAPPLKEYLGEAFFGLDRALSPWDGSDDEIELLGSPQKWIIPSNWKIVAENFSGDLAHNISHASVDKVGIGTDSKEGRRDDPGEFILSGYPEGHGIIFGLKPPGQEPNDYQTSPITTAYYLENWRRRQERQGESGRVNPVVGTIFPNMSFHGQQPRTILVAHPNGPGQTEMWRVYFVDKKAPPEVKAFLRRYYTRYSGPAGMTEQDDMENWNYATSSCLGSVARNFPFNYKAGLGATQSHPLIPGAVTMNPALHTEENVRRLYKRWADVMDSSNWQEIKAKSKGGK